MGFFSKKKINIRNTPYSAMLYKNGAFYRIDTYIYDLRGGIHINFYTAENLPLITADGNIFSVYSIGEEPNDPNNLVPLSINSNGTIYNNGLGYKSGYRLSSSGEEKTQIDSVVTGFIPATPNDIIKMEGVSWCPTVSSGYSYICFYDENFNKLAHINEYVGGTSNGVSNLTAGTVLTNSIAAHNIITDENGITTFDLDYVDGASFSYIRISAEGIGSEMVVKTSKKAELITFFIEGVEFQAEKAMLWEQWCISEYNTENIISQDGYIKNNLNYFLSDSAGATVYSSDRIWEGSSYRWLNVAEPV